MIPNLGATLTRALFGLVVVALLALGVACGGDGGDDGGGPTQPPPTDSGATQAPVPTSATQIGVNLTEYIVAPDPASIAAGTVTFVARNIGGTDHELVVIKTDRAQDDLPTKDNGSVDGGDEDVTVVGDTDPFPKEEERALTLTLEPGSYVLVCDVVQEIEGEEPVIHYQKGMNAAFEVTQ